MSVSEESKVRIDWLMKEYEINFALFRMYQLMRGTLMLGAIAGMSVLTKLYGDSIRVFKGSYLSASGILTHSKGLLPEPFAFAIISFVVITVAAWSVAGDIYLERYQKIAGRRCAAIESVFMNQGRSFQLLGGLQRRKDIFDLGRGLLILLSAIWVVTFGIGALMADNQKEQPYEVLLPR